MKRPLGPLTVKSKMEQGSEADRASSNLSIFLGALRPACHVFNKREIFGFFGAREVDAYETSLALHVKSRH